MADQAQPKKPETLDELEQELDKDALSPEVVSVESQEDDDVPPPDPRGALPGGPAVRVPKIPEDDPINEKDLEAAMESADETDDPNDRRQLSDNRLHLEKNPNAPRPHFWRRKKFWFSLIFLLVLLLALAWFVRPARLYIVNNLGLRGDIKVTTMTRPEEGQEAGLLKKVTIEINGAPWETDEHGVLPARLSYGDIKIVAKKAGYETVEHQLMVDFDPFFYLLGGRQKDETDRDIKLQLKAVGLPLKFQVKDWLTGGPVVTGAFGVGEVVAKPNSEGLVDLVLPATDAKTVKVAALFGGKYLDKEFELPLDGSQQTVTVVPAGKEYFISNRSGGLAVYGSDLDGSNVTEVVPASTNETAAMTITISPSGKYGMLASTREGKRDAQGTLLQQLYAVDLSNKKLTVIDQAHWFNFVDWSGDTLVYTVGERKTGAAVTQRLASADATNNKKVDLSSTGTFGPVRVAQASVMYQTNVPPSDPAVGNSPEQKVVPVKGGTEKSLGTKVQQIAQLDPERFAFQTGDGAWQEYNANKSQIKPSSAPSTPNRVYLSSTTPDGQNRLAIDKVDGKPALIARSVGNGQEKQLYTATGIRGPIRLLDDVIIFRVSDGTQTADYALSVRGGNPKKIMDVTQPTAPFAANPSYISLY
ncbi:MAG TPA: hypothetical protein VJM32_00285 [Candidatus Saccharimonadales bacterium]|nr:hypothetical protein [Candidatus Saccharimonadales bacterium]